MRHPSLSGEDRFLFSYSVPPKEGAGEEPPSPGALQALDWDYIYGTASFHMIAQAVYFNLAERGTLDAVPPDIRQKLKKLFHGNLSRNLGLRKKFGEILRAVAGERIPVAVLKGAAFLDRLYENPALRQMLDLDLLVKKADCQRVFDRLLALGYSVQKPYDEPGSEAWFNHFCYHMRPLISPDRKLVVEIHWDLIRPDVLKYYPFYGGLDIEDFWDNGLVEQFVAGEKTMVLKPAYNLLHLSLHNIAHQLQLASFNMNNLRDMYYILDDRAAPVDRDLLISLARRHHLKKAVYFSFFMLRAFLNRPADEQVMASLNPGALSIKMFRSYLDHLFSQHYKEIERKQVNRLAQIGFADSSYGPAGTALRYLFPPGKIMAERFPRIGRSGGLFFAYIVFPFLTLGKVIRQLFRWVFFR